MQVWGVAEKSAFQTRFQRVQRYWTTLAKVGSKIPLSQSGLNVGICWRASKTLPKCSGWPGIGVFKHMALLLIAGSQVPLPVPRWASKLKRPCSEPRGIYCRTLQREWLACAQKIPNSLKGLEKAALKASWGRGANSPIGCWSVRSPLSVLGHQWIRRLWAHDYQAVSLSLLVLVLHLKNSGNVHELHCPGTSGRSCTRGWEGSAPGRPRRVLRAYSSSSPSDPESSVLLDVRATGVSGAGLRLTPEGCSGEEMRKRSKVSALRLPWRGRSANLDCWHSLGPGTLRCGAWKWKWCCSVVSDS